MSNAAVAEGEGEGSGASAKGSARDVRGRAAVERREEGGCAGAEAEREGEEGKGEGRATRKDWRERIATVVRARREARSRGVAGA